MRTVRTVVILFAILIGIVLSVCFVLVKSGLLNARKKPSALEYTVANYALRLSIPAEAKNARNPIQLNPAALNDANKYFSENCSVCHANDGSGRTDTAKGLSPEVPDLHAAHVQSLTDGEMFYIIKNGVRFTGMPGWDLRKEQIWKLVLFIRQFANHGTPLKTSNAAKYPRPLARLASASFHNSFTSLIDTEAQARSSNVWFMYGSLGRT